MEKIFKLSDKNLQKNKAQLLLFAKSKGVKYYSQYIYETLSLGVPAREIVKDMRAFGIVSPPAVSSVWGCKYRCEQVRADKADETVEKGDKICGTDGCERKVTPPNHFFCNYCDRQHKSISIDESYFESRYY